MEEIGKPLRHAQQRSAAIYAKVDQPGWTSWPCPAHRERAMSMRAYAEEYLAMRQSLGYELRGEGPALPDFAARLNDAGRQTTTMALAASGGLRESACSVG